MTVFEYYFARSVLSKGDLTWFKALRNRQPVAHFILSSAGFVEAIICSIMFYNGQIDVMHSNVVKDV